MIYDISKKITDRLLFKNVIDKDDWEIYQYGMYQLILNSVDIVTILLLGIIFKELWQCIVYVGVFVSMRVYAGGYHASTPLRCYLITTLTTAVALLVMKYIEVGYFVWTAMLFVSSLVILVLAPIESENKPLDIMEKKIYRKRTCIIWGVETVLAVIFAFLKVKSVFICVTMAEIMLGIALIYEKIAKLQLNKS